MHFRRRTYRSIALALAAALVANLALAGCCLPGGAGLFGGTIVICSAEGEKTIPDPSSPQGEGAHGGSCDMLCAGAMLLAAVILLLVTRTSPVVFYGAALFAPLHPNDPPYLGRAPPAFA